MLRFDERETVYQHIEGNVDDNGNKYFMVSAAERWSINMVKRLKEKYPDEVDIRHVNKDGSLTARLPFEWMRIRQKKTLSDEQKTELAKRLRPPKAND